MSQASPSVAENVAQIRRQIADAAARSGRTPDAVTLVAVTKYVPVDAVRAVVAAGCHDLGESRPQQLWERAASLADLPIRWHMIGHLQRNKVRRTVPLVTLIHSVDSARLAAAVNEGRETGDGGRGSEDNYYAQHENSFSASPAPRPSSPVPILLEINVSGEVAKTGFAPETIEPALAELAGYQNLAVRGLMCMASLEGDLDAARREFAALRELRDRLRGHCPPGITLDELSMGMSRDFEVAIEEGATIVRVGSALFEGID